jgi:glycosyltransferase involved in cell wall biosynthesis
MKIIFFIDTLTSGGKERRMLELIGYLKQHTDHTLVLVLTENLIYYEYVYALGIEIKVIKRKGFKYDPTLFFRFYRFCCHFKPDIIHAWGRMTTFYSIPTKLLRRIPLISNLIADTLGTTKLSRMNALFFKVDVFFSTVILSNSEAGLKAYKINIPKAKVIWNGVHLERFQRKYDLENIRKQLNVSTKNYIIVMIAAFSKLKDYDLFLDVAKEIRKIRDDIVFLGVGDGMEWKRINQRIKDEQISNVILTGKQKDVERIIAVSDIGILCTYSEGISNSIIECMALGKPVISTDTTGGSKEIIINGETGYCIQRNSELIVDSINFLLNNKDVRISMGNNGKERIYTHFSIEKMGEVFKVLYTDVLNHFL